MDERIKQIQSENKGLKELNKSLIMLRKELEKPIPPIIEGARPISKIRSIPSC
jgi:hypothetical protein